MDFRKILFWTTRIFTILIVLFFYLFIAKSFAEQFNIYSFLMSSVPGTILLLTLILSWRWENFGILFFLYGLGYFGLATSQKVSWISVVIISVPLCISGILFFTSFLNSKKKKKPRK